ncbi:chromosome 10 open reading frame 88 [Plakobranchus ocellatus]|uniref:Chromosome 10 open reading frame 88 n=1 Tax=Plakobranchus ocellatus TaxID=259542 RepID=A0AAV4B410_9GAST|nr:chromosome 10 open reading frame 88 [Plakobranchus ocellatus]
MACRSNLCNIAFSWSPDGSPAHVTKFTYLDVTDLNKENDEISIDFESDRLAGDVDFCPETQLWLTREGSDEDSKYCILHLTCPKPDFAQINGVSVISESRTLEVSNELKGYITTARGKKLSQRLSQVGVDGSNSSDLYSCSCFLEESCPSLSLKFLSIGNRSAFCVQSICINIIQHGLQSPPVKGSLDITKLKKDIEDMGSLMSERAKDFMSTLEQYEKNKIDKSSGLLAATLGNSSTGTSTNGLSSIMSSILGTGTMKSLAKSSIGSDGDQQDMYKILNSVCGSVANLRVASVKQENTQCETDVKTCDDTALKAKSENLAVSTENMDKLKSELRSELSEIKQEMLTEIHEVKLELNQKLDSILHLLQDLKSVEEKT